VVRPLKRLLGCNTETGMGNEEQACETMVMNVVVVVVMVMVMMMVVIHSLVINSPTFLILYLISK